MTNEDIPPDVEQDAGGIFRVQKLLRTFYVAARRQDLKARPLPVEIWGVPLVLYRDPEGSAVALLDRCPHRNVPLSSGRVCATGELECAYHGWRFSNEGKCTHIPGRVAGLEARYQVPKFQVREDRDFVWVCPSELGPLSEPFPLPHRDDRSYTTVVREVAAEASLFAVVENALDVPHTAVLHRGLFRSGKRNRVKVTVTQYLDSVEARYEGEPVPKGLLARLLSLGGAAETRAPAKEDDTPTSGNATAGWSTSNEGNVSTRRDAERRAGGATSAFVQHWDRFFLPSVLQVEYRLGATTHFVITGLCTPVTDHKTKIFAVATYRTPLPGRLLAVVLEPVARWVFAQDARLLKRQTRQTRRFGGEQFAFTELDAIGPGLWRLLRQAKEQESTPTGGGLDSNESEGAALQNRRAVRTDTFEMDA